MNSKLTNIYEYTVKFSDVDLLGMVWHGNYVKLLENGREAFGKQYGIGYWDIFNQGYVTPIVNVNIDYKKSLRYGDEVIIKTTFVDCEAAKIIFEYTLFRKSDNELIATAQTTQVFLNDKRQLYLTLPEFYIQWKKKNGLLKI